MGIEKLEKCDDKVEALREVSILLTEAKIFIRKYDRESALKKVGEAKEWVGLAKKHMPDIVTELEDLSKKIDEPQDEIKRDNFGKADFTISEELIPSIIDLYMSEFADCILKQ